MGSQIDIGMGRDQRDVAAAKRSDRNNGIIFLSNPGGKTNKFTVKYGN